MKKIFTILLVVFSVSFCKAQWVTIPDANFVSWLQTNYPSCMNGNLMDTTCNGVMNDTLFYCDSYNISDLTGVQYFNSLTEMVCSNNQISTLPLLNNSLKSLDCSFNQLTSLPSLSINLKFLVCSFNQLMTLPTLPSSMIVIDCHYNQISNLPTLPPSLLTLNCQSNLITNLPILPPNLTQLACGSNPLMSLPPLPNTITNLGIYNLQLSNLDSLPTSLVLLDAGANQFTALPSLPSTITFINCHTNQILSLPTLPPYLTTLNCYDNQLTSLPALPASLTNLTCWDNLLTSLPSLPPSLFDFRVNDNPNLQCMPALIEYTGPTSYSFNISGTGIECLPNLIQHSGYIPSIDTMPICGIFYPSGCTISWNISGETYLDQLNNCIVDSNEIHLLNIPIQLWNGVNLLQEIFTVNGGTNSFDVSTFDTFEIKIDTSNLPFSVSCPNGGIQTSIISAIDSMDSNVDFALVCKPDFDVAVNSVARDSGLFFPGNKSLINIHAGDFANFYGANCMNGIGGQLQVLINGPAQYIGYAAGSLSPTTVSGNTLTWNIADFGAIDFFNDFHIRLVTDTTPNGIDFVCIDATISSNPADVNQSNNQLNQCFNVVNSYDPNMKEVFPFELNSTNNYLTYTIHFQNTGTAPAQHIQIIDTLDTDFDLSAFQLLAYSHQNMTQVLEGGIVHFNFPSINLPDSVSNEPASHGYIQYKIKPKANTPLTSSFDNTANIYFDFNSPVVTNTTHTSFATGISQLTIDLSHFTIFPNPANESATILLSFPCENCSIEISNTLGQIFICDKLNLKSKILNLNSFPSGIYFCIVKTDDGKMMQQKFVVAK